MKIMKKRYIELMARALSAYTDEHINNYFTKVKTEGLTEHGFPRLTANLGILISHGIRTDLLPLFCEMMDFCCKHIPRVKAANDFSVREIVLCLMEVERAEIVDKSKIDGWKAALGTIVATSCYDRFAILPTDNVHNWACFTALSEFMRLYIGLGADPDFIDTQIASQLLPLDENGMYRDPHEPMVYDLVPRGLFALLLHFGYNGRYRDKVDNCLRTAGLHTLKMQSVTGEIPYGGRSNHCVFNEALIAIVLEYEAARYAREGNTALAAQFKAGVKLALDATERYLSLSPIHHVKNRFPLESRYGCEKYAYFDKYMITTASYLYSAYLLCDDSIEASDGVDNAAWQTSEHFHKVFMRHGNYSLEFDTNADTHYDISGLGRVHRRGAPSPICMSLPCTSKPKYTIDIERSNKLSLCPCIKQDGEWQLGTSVKTKYELNRLDCSDTCAEAQLLCTFEGGGKVAHSYCVNNNGICITARGEGEIGYILPAFVFDGQTSTVITATENTLEISYLGWLCRYTTDARISELDRPARNRSGHYRTFIATGKNQIKIKIEIIKA